MKSFKLILITLSILIIYSCTTNDLEDIKSETQFTINNKASAVSYGTPIVSKNELIIQYKSGVLGTTKSALRTFHNVSSFEVCNLCPDGAIERWVFGTGVDLEHKIGSIETGSGGGGPEGLIINVDNEFNFYTEIETNSLAGGSSSGSYFSQIVEVNDGITIAILDSGIDVNFPTFNHPFLYNASYENIPGIYSGWDFVNSDDNCYDDYYLVHGTTVTYFVENTLKNLEIPHQILPVKVSDNNGYASYFNILCGLSYALPRSNIVQMSLGWYSQDSDNNIVDNIFTSLLETYEDEVLVVTSAGNNGTNNDAIVHFPSSYPQENMLAIASSNEGNTDIAYFSNYGRESVDFYAEGENVIFYDINNNPVPVSGTSFSAPYVSAIAAKLLYNSGMNLNPQQLISALNDYGTTVFYSKTVKYSKLIH